MAELKLCCPACGRPNNAHDGIDSADQQPAPGAVSICWGCREIALFDDGPLGLTLRPPTPVERAEIEADPGVRRARAAMAESYIPDQAVALARGGQP